MVHNGRDAVVEYGSAIQFQPYRRRDVDVHFTLGTNRKERKFERSVARCKRILRTACWGSTFSSSPPWSGSHSKLRTTENSVAFTLHVGVPIRHKYVQLFQPQLSTPEWHPQLFTFSFFHTARERKFIYSVMDSEYATENTRLVFIRPIAGHKPR